MIERFKNLFGMTKVRDFFILPWTQVVVIYGGLLWSLPGAMVGQYKSLYLVSLGLSNTEVGVYSFLFIPLGLASLWVAGYLTDVWGRRRTLFLFDSISWVGFCLCMALATNKWWAMAALFFFAVNQGSGPPYQCLIVEGVEASRQAVVYAVLQITNLAPYLFLFPLIGGYWVGRQGLGPACHQMYAFFTFMVVLGIVLRFYFLSHSGIHEKLPATWKHGLKEGLEQYRKTFGDFFKKKGAVLFVGSRILDEWLIATSLVYGSLYYVQQVGLKDTSLATLTQVTSYLACGLLFFVIPKLSAGGMTRWMGVDQLLALAGLLVLLIRPSDHCAPFAICLTAGCLASAGSSFYYSVTSSLWMGLIGEKERAKVVAVTVTLFQGALWGLGSLSAFIYGHISPVTLILLMVAVRVVNFFLLRRVKVVLESPLHSN